MVKKINKIESRLNEFLAIASHQFKTPLANLGWSLELLNSNELGPLNKEQKKVFEKCDSGRQKMNDLITVLMEVLRLENHQLSPKVDRFEAIGLLKKVAKELVGKKQN